MDDSGELRFAAATAMMIAYTCAGARGLHYFMTQGLERRTQAWRRRWVGWGRLGPDNGRYELGRDVRYDGEVCPLSDRTLTTRRAD